MLAHSPMLQQTPKKQRSPFQGNTGLYPEWRESGHFHLCTPDTNIYLYQGHQGQSRAEQCNLQFHMWEKGKEDELLVKVG